VQAFARPEELPARPHGPDPGCSILHSAEPALLAHYVHWATLALMPMFIELTFTAGDA
jgi:hypothetical protein